jgi:prepilin-type N-terminal cleavage/methylation domain-containing protein
LIEPLSRSINTLPKTQVMRPAHAAHPAGIRRNEILVRQLGAGNRRGHGGFTMVELVIVMFIMGIFAALTAPAFYDSLLFHRVESAARRVKADLELVRQTARLTSTEQTLTVLGTTYSASAAVADLDRPTQTYVVDLSKSPYKLNTVSANFGGYTEVRFNGYGAAVKPDGTALASGTIILTASNHQCTVTLDGTTGQVSITSNHTGGRTAKVIGN